MNLTLFKALAALILVLMLCGYSIITRLKENKLSSALQLVGASCLFVVVFTHLCEALHLLSRMGWGNADSAGHYLDLVSAIAGLTLLPLGYLLRAVRTR